MGIYFGADLAIDLYGERPKVDAYGNFVELYAFVEPDGGWERTRTNVRAADVIRSGRGRAETGGLERASGRTGEPGWTVHNRSTQTPPSQREEVARVRAADWDAGFERVVVQELLPVRSHWSGWSCNSGMTWKFHRGLEIVRVVSDWTKDAWMLPGRRGCDLMCRGEGGSGRHARPSRCRGVSAWWGLSRVCRPGGVAHPDSPFARIARWSRSRWIWGGGAGIFSDVGDVVVDGVVGGVEGLGDLFVGASGVEEAFDGFAFFRGRGRGEGVVESFGELLS